MISIPPCPMCGTSKKSTAMAGGMFRCGNCGGLYDREPHEGGTHSTFNPAARLEREERRRERHQRRR